MALLKGIKAGTVVPSTLSPDQRRPLVALLMAEGHSTAEIAHLLDTSDRTVERDKKAIREDSAISQDPELANIMAGRLVDEAQICIQRIRKFQRNGDCPPAAKIEGEKNCFSIINDLTERLQSMGYLPIASRRLEASLVHNTDNMLSLAEMGSEIQRLQDIEVSLPVRKVKKVKSKALKRKKREG
jgi:transposase